MYPGGPTHVVVVSEWYADKGVNDDISKIPKVQRSAELLLPNSRLSFLKPSDPTTRSTCFTPMMSAAPTCR